MATNTPSPGDGTRRKRRAPPAKEVPQPPAVDPAPTTQTTTADVIEIPESPPPVETQPPVQYVGVTPDGTPVPSRLPETWLAKYGAAIPLKADGPSGLEGLPAEYNDGSEWLYHGLSRHSKAVFAALLAGWTGLWIAIWGAAVGLLIGALAAGGIATTLGAKIGVGEAAGLFGVIFGGFVGMLGAFAVVVLFLIAGGTHVVISILSGAVLAVLIIIAVALFERLFLRLRGYRRLSRAEVRRISPSVKDAADAMNLAALPRFAMADNVLPNAWTHMRTIVLTTGLLTTLTDQELQAVLVHELEHWRKGDAVGLRFVWAAAWPVAILYNLGMSLTGQTPEGRPRGRVTGSLLALVGWIIAFPSWVLTKLIILPLVAASQRRYEYDADKAASDLGLGDDLASALPKLTAFEGGRTGWERAMTATHPPTQLRLDALAPVQQDDWYYQEGELRRPTWKEARRLLTFWKHWGKKNVAGTANK